MNQSVVPYFGRAMRVICDRNCNKAWGINSRPSIHLSDDPDDYAFLADGELGDAPVDPGTYEGGQAKPLTPDDFPTKWCVRECERCEKTGPMEYEKPLELPDFSVRFYNQPWRRQP